jgi:ABC-type branched-subunit amino acid transport system ATPase component
VPPPLLRVERLTRHFAGLAALQEVSFELAAGGICGLIGPNGAGKTTLLAVLAGALRPTSGRVIFRERDVTAMPAFAVARAGIVRTHQVPKPFRSLSVAENVEVGVRFGRAGGTGGKGGGGGQGTGGAAAAEAVKAVAGGAAAAGLAGGHLPGGPAGASEASEATEASERGPASEAMRVLDRVGLAHRAQSAAGTLSVGDQKRLELARCLAARPSLLLCDEVCSGLTSAESAAVLALLREIRDAGTTILYVEHDLKAIMAVCDRVIVMNFGRKLADGTPAAVQGDEAVIAAYIGAKGAKGIARVDETAGGERSAGDGGAAGG